MRIIYTEFVADPKLRNTIANFPAHVAQSLIASGQAVAMPWKSYIERLNAEHEQPRSAMPGDTAVPNIEGVKWGIAEHPLAGTVILRESGSETTRFQDADTAENYGAPAALLNEFRKIIGAREKTAAEIQQATQNNSWGGTKIRFV